MSTPRGDVSLLLLDDLRDWPIDLPFGDAPFSLLLVLDDRDVGEDGFAAWTEFAERTLSQGLAYFCTWGPDCERLHDLMDEVTVGSDVLLGRQAPFVMTTWHEGEALEDTLEFLVNVAVEPERQKVATAPAIIALVGREDLADQVAAFFRSLGS